MAYTDRQARCLSAMGLIAWEERTLRPTPLPRAPEALARWLPSASLGVFRYREKRLTRVGQRDAPLLVIAEAAPGDAMNPPLSGQADSLFENMLRAIGRRQHDTCQCKLADVPEAAGDTVASLSGRQHRVALVLVRELDAELSADACRLTDVVPVAAAWCLPHPELLLARPERKRQAWEILRAVREHLASAGHS